MTPDPTALSAIETELTQHVSATAHRALTSHGAFIRALHSAVHLSWFWHRPAIAVAPNGQRYRVTVTPIAD